MSKKKSISTPKIGQYIQSSSYFSKLKWKVRLDKNSYYECETQTEAEILSRLVRIERLLLNIKNKKEE